MATQEELILAQTRAGASDIYKPKLDDKKSGFLQDATAGIMSMQAFNESLYAAKGAVKDFERDYRTGKFTDGSLMDRFGRSVFGMKKEEKEGEVVDVAEDNTSDSEESSGNAEGNLPIGKITKEINNDSNSIDINNIAFETSDAESTMVDMSELENDFVVGTNNVEVDMTGNMVVKPFDVKKEIINPAMKPNVSRQTTFIGPVGDVFPSELEEIFPPSADLLSDNYSSQYSLSQMEQLPESVRKDISSMPSGYFNLTDEQVKNNYNNFIVKDRINTLIEFGDTFGYGGGNQDINAIPKVQNALDVYTRKYMEKKGLEIK